MALEYAGIAAQFKTFAPVSQMGQELSGVKPGLALRQRIPEFARASLAVGGVPAGQFATGQTLEMTGKTPSCFRWALPTAPMRPIMRVEQGQGMAAAQVYER